MVATCSKDRTVRLYSPAGVHLDTLQGAADELNCVSFSPKGRLLASGCSDANAYIWDVKTRSVVQVWAYV
eukprot:58538-Chlamydomonas_euryale.AAC.1